MTQLSDYHSAVIEEICGAIYFRSGVAERYPDDARNIQCVASLKRLKDNLDQLTEDDPRMVKCFETYKSKHEAAGNSEFDWNFDSSLWFPKSDDELAGAGFASKQVFSQYGFHGPEGGDPGEFLESLSSEIESWEIDDLSVADELS